MARTGRPKGSGMTPLAVRFWRYVRKGEPSECWEWAGYKQKGYGAIGLGSADLGMARAHRVSWELHNGPIPAGLVVCHRCDNRGCVNPTHLFVGTHEDNMADMAQKDRGRKPGTPNRGTKLTPDDVRAIRAWIAKGGSSSRLAEEFGISPGMVRQIARGEAWTHIDAPEAALAKGE